jgi:uncharacterized protein (TIGR02246 family)
MTTTTTSGTGSIIAESTQAEVLAVLRDLYAAWAAYDAVAFADLYLEDATVVMPGIRHENRDAIRTYMARAFDGPLKGSRAVDEPISVRVLHDETAVVLSRAGILMAGETEVPAARLRIATWVLVRRDDRWRIAAYSNAAANPTAG